MQRAESEHPGWEGCQERRPLHSPGRTTNASFQRDVPSPCARLLSPGVGEARPPPLQAAWISEPVSERGVERLEISLASCQQPRAAIKVTDRLGRGRGGVARTGEGQARRQGTVLTSPHLRFLTRVQAGVAISQPLPLSPPK